MVSEETKDPLRSTLDPTLLKRRTQTMSSQTPLQAPVRDHLDWPFFGDEHRALARELHAFIAVGGLGDVAHNHVDVACKHLVETLGKAGFLRHCVPRQYG